jgi:Circularly permutated YpsA SLOG family
LGQTAKSPRPVLSDYSVSITTSEQDNISDSSADPRSSTHLRSVAQSKYPLVDRIVSGGQTGVDRAALDVAIALDIAHGGWCPLGRIAEDGRIGDCYHLQEHPSPKYTERTKSNVLDSDATLVLYRWTLEGGSLKTLRFAQNVGKPCLKIRLTHPGSIERVRDWVLSNKICTLNIAGPRASKEPQIYQKAYEYLVRLFRT